MMEMSKYRHVEFKIYNDELVERMTAMPIDRALGLRGVQYYIFAMMKDEEERLYIHGYMQSARSYTQSSWLKRMRGDDVKMLKGHDDHNLLISSIRMNEDVWEGGIYTRVGRHTPIDGFDHILLTWMQYKYIQIYGEMMCVGDNTECRDEPVTDTSWLEYVIDDLKYDE